MAGEGMTPKGVAAEAVETAAADVGSAKVAAPAEMGAAAAGVPTTPAAATTTTSPGR
jgi:hypothetical protein